MTIGRGHEGPLPNEGAAIVGEKPPKPACAGIPPPRWRSRRLQQIKPQIASLAPPEKGAAGGGAGTRSDDWLCSFPGRRSAVRCGVTRAARRAARCHGRAARARRPLRVQTVAGGVARGQRRHGSTPGTGPPTGAARSGVAERRSSERFRLPLARSRLPPPVECHGRSFGAVASTSAPMAASVMTANQISVDPQHRQADHEAGEQCRPQVHEQHRLAVRVAHVLQPVVQVLPVGVERRHALHRPADHREQHVRVRDEPDRDRDDQRQDRREPVERVRARVVDQDVLVKRRGGRDRPVGEQQAEQVRTRRRP